MKFIQQALPLLALCQLALASRCKPNSSFTTSVLITSTTESIPSSTTALEELSSTSQYATSSITISTSSEIESGTSESSIITTTLITTTLSAEPSTTTSISQEPTNLLLNPGWEDKNTIAPWTRSGSFGSVTLSTSEFHEGSQSGYFTGTPGGPANLGFKQFIDPSLIEVGKNYQFSVYVKRESSSSCFNFSVACGLGTAYFNTASIQGPSGEWNLATITCQWTQAFWEAGPNVQVFGTCERLSFYIDNASLEES